MLNLKQIAAKQKALADELNPLLDKDNLTADEEARIEEIDAELKSLDSQKVKAERAERLRAGIAANQEWADTLQEDPAEMVELDDAVSRVESVSERLLESPSFGFDRYEEFATAVRVGSRQGAVVDHRLQVIRDAYGNNTEVGEEGGFLVPPEYSNRIIERANNVAPVIEQCDRLTLSGSSVTINGLSDADRNSATYRHGGVVVYWVEEGSQITRSSLKFRKITLKPHKMAALSFVTSEMLTGVANFGSRLISMQGSAIADELLEAVMFGTGAGQPTGAFTGTTVCVEVAAEDGQAADTVVAENVINMNSVIADGSQARGMWLYNGEVLPQLETMAIAVGTGGIPVYMPPNGLSEREYGILKGRPAYRTDHCEALGDAGDIVFGDFSQYLLATRGTPETAMSMHLRFDYDEVAYRTTFSVDGRPAWDRSLKPRKGASDRRVSPFVKLAERA